MSDNPRCGVHLHENGEFECQEPHHEGYAHARDANDVEAALDAWRSGRTPHAVFDCDGDAVERVVSSGDGYIDYAYEGGVTGNQFAYILVPIVPEPEVTPEEVEAAIESIRNTTI